MKKLLCLLLLLFMLPMSALSDGPPLFAEALFSLDAPSFAAQCEAALADTALAGSTVAEKEGVPVVAWDEYHAFAAMRRPDGLLMLCCFVPDGDGIALDWHNDLLLSYYQQVYLGMEGAAWSGGILPELWVDFAVVNIMLPLVPGIYLSLIADPYSRGECRVTDMTLYYVTEDKSWVEALHVPEDCLAEDIYLATCKPDDWRRGEEETSYGW